MGRNHASKVRRRATRAARTDAGPVVPTRADRARSVPLPLIHQPLVMIAVASALSAVGAVWISLQPTATHSALDGAIDGAMVRWLFYLPPTLLAVWATAWAMHVRAPFAGRPAVRTALLLALLAVVGGTVGEIGARALLGHGDVLARDGVLQRVIELVRANVPAAAVAVIVLARLSSTTARFDARVPQRTGRPG